MALKPINWTKPTVSEEGVKHPTYGEYGGAAYSSGKVLKPGETPSFAATPVDALDETFREHDQVSYRAISHRDQALADRELIDDIKAIPDAQMSPEAHLYAGWAILAMMEQIAVKHHQPGLLSLSRLAAYTKEAAHHLALGRPEPDRAETAAFATWLKATAGLDDPFGFGADPAPQPVPTASADPKPLDDLASHLSTVRDFYF
jgi:hypothetical protein